MAPLPADIALVQSKGTDTRVGGELTMELRCQLTVAGTLTADHADDGRCPCIPVLYGEASGRQLSVLIASSFSSFGRRLAVEEEWFGDAVIECHGRLTYS